MASRAERPKMPAEGEPASLELLSTSKQTPRPTDAIASAAGMDGASPAAEAATVDYTVSEDSLVSRLARASIELAHGCSKIGDMALRGDLVEMARSVANHF